MNLNGVNYKPKEISKLNPQIEKNFEICKEYSSEINGS